MKVLLLFILFSYATTPPVNAEGNFYKSKSDKTYYVEAAYNSTWYEAYIECTYRNMALVSLEHRGKFEDVHQMLSSTKLFTTDHIVNIWIGALGHSKRFSWISSGEPVITTLWSPSNPDNKGGEEHCLHVYNSYVNDITCNRKLGFVCEKRMESEINTTGGAMPKNNIFQMNFGHIN